MSKFSIIVPCYNLEKYIAQAIDSVLAQTYGDFECIVVDDGSTDMSSGIIDTYAAKDERVRAVHKENGGEGSARNAGLDVATGEWILYLDGDDVCRETLLEDVDKVVAERQVEVVGFGMRVFTDGDALIWGRSDGAFREIDCAEAIPNVLGMHGFSQCAYRRTYFFTRHHDGKDARADSGKSDFVGGLRFDSYSIGADLVYFSRCLSMAKKMILLDKEEYAYRVRKGSASHSQMSYRQMRDTIAFQLEMFENFRLSGKSLGSMFSRARGNHWIFRTAYLLDEFDRQGACGDLWKAYYDSMVAACSMRFFSGLQRGAAKMVSMIRSRVFTRLICVFPYKLRQGRR